MDDILSDSSALLSIYSLEKAEKRKVFLDCSSLRHLNLHILVLYVKIHLKKNYRNLTAMIIAVYKKKMLLHSLHTLTTSLASISAFSIPLFFQVGLPDAGAGGAKYLCPDLLLSGQVWVRKHRLWGARGDGTLGRAVCIIHESPLLSGQLFSIQIPDVVQSVLHSLSWLLAIDHKQGARALLNKRRGFMLRGSKRLTDRTKIHH